MGKVSAPALTLDLMNGLLFHFADPDHYAPNDWPFILERNEAGPALFVGARDGDNANDGLKGIFVLQPPRTDC